MSVNLDATVSSVSANSYNTLAEADSYFTKRLYGSSFTSKTDDDDRRRALIMACQRIEQENFLGYRTVIAQALKWPRVGVEVPGEWFGRYYLPTEIPQLVKDAQCELALVVAGSDIFTPTGAENLKMLKVGPIELEFKEGISTGILPDTVSRLLRGLRVGGGIAQMIRA